MRILNLSGMKTRLLKNTGILETIRVSKTVAVENVRPKPFAADAGSLPRMLSALTPDVRSLYTIKKIESGGKGMIRLSILD